MALSSDRPSKMCPAMKESGIKKPTSQEGVNFCLNCPYDCCVCYEGKRSHGSKFWENLKYECVDA